MIARAVIAIAAFLFVGCQVPKGQPPKVVVDASFWMHGDTRFVPGERASVERALSDWKRFSKGRVNILVAWDLDEARFFDLRDQPRILKVDSFDPRTRAVDASLSNGVVALGFFRPADETVPMTVAIVSDRVQELYPVILHEIGHVVGLDDLQGGGSVMSRLDAVPVFTSADLEECVRVGVCVGL